MLMMLNVTLSLSSGVIFCLLSMMGEDWQQRLRWGERKQQDQYQSIRRPIPHSKGHRTNPGTEAEPQQIVAQGYSHAYSTTFHS